MREIEQTREQLRNWTNSLSPSVIVSAKVTAVNDDDTVAVVFADGAEIDDCRLKSVVKDGDKWVIVPKVGSTVLVGRIEKSDEFTIIAVEEITEITCNIGNTRYSQNADGFLMAKGTDGMLEIIKMIIESVMEVVVIQGKNPNYIKLQEALQKATNLLQNAT